MPQSLVQIPVHIVFSTRGREARLSDTEMRKSIYRYMVGIGRKMDSPIVRINGPADHVHILVNLSKNGKISELVRTFKVASSKWCKTQFPQLSAFHWQKGYGAFATSPSRVDRVIRYIERQEEHHRKVTFKEEFRILCIKAGIVIDERYVWD